MRLFWGARFLMCCSTVFLWEASRLVSAFLWVEDWSVSNYWNDFHLDDKLDGKESTPQPQVGVVSVSSHWWTLRVAMQVCELQCRDVKCAQRGPLAQNYCTFTSLFVYNLNNTYSSKPGGHKTRTLFKSLLFVDWSMCIADWHWCYSSVQSMQFIYLRTTEAPVKPGISNSFFCLCP